MATKPKEQEKPAATPPGTAIVQKEDTPTEAWLKGHKGVEISMTPSGLVMWLPDNLSRDCHMTVASTQITQTDPNYRWVPKLVKLTEAEHTYPEGRDVALNKKGLQLLGDASGIQFLEPLADHMGGTGIRYTARARKRGSDGTWDARSDDKTVRFAHLERKARRERKASIDKFAEDGKDWATALLADPAKLEAELVKYVDDQMEHIDAKTLTKAMNRVLRSWLSIKSTYKKGEIESKAFLCISWVLAPDYSNPLVRDIIAMNHRAADATLYTGDRDVAQLPAPRPIADERPDRPADVDEHGEVIDGTVVDADAAPPRPEDDYEFPRGPFQGQKIDAVVEDEDGRRYVAGLVMQINPGDLRDRLLAWLAFAEQRPVRVEDCADLAKRPDDADIPF